MIQKPRLRLVLVGLAMIASFSLVAVSSYWLVPGIVLMLTGIYLVAWGTIGKGGWCRICKKFSVLPN